MAKCTDEGISVAEIPIDEDALSEVFGKEKKSRTRGFSNHISKKQLGRTTISKIYTEQARASHRELTNGMDQMKDMMMVMMQKMKNMEDSFNSQPRPNFHTPSTEVDSNEVDRTGATRRNLINLFETSDMHPPRVSPTQANSSEVNKNPKVILLSTNGEPVAKGYVPTDLRGGTCHSKKILPCESRVYVTEVIDGMDLIHAAPQDGNSIMQDVTEGGFLIWLNDLLKYI